ncbi:MAG: S8 family serine peptidase [Bacteroidales bacterium]|nr:S8 family serine peptidase [Bacteroidales bacterium]
MKTIKIILSLGMVILSMTSAVAQTFHYAGDKKFPIEIIPNIKVILCEDTIKTPINLEKGDSLIKQLNLKNSLAVVYREGENSRTCERYSDKNAGNICVYPAYISDTGDMIVPTGCIETILRNEADTILLKEICKEYDCVISSRSQYHTTWNTLRMKPKPGRNPVILSNTLQEDGRLEVACPIFWMTDMLQISYDPETTKQWSLYNPDSSIDISVSSAWNYATGRNIKIGVIDSGFDIEQEDLKQRIYDSYDLETKSSPCRKISEHGTRCAGIVAATRNNDKGIAGVAPDATLLLASIPTGDSMDTNILGDAFDWCRKKGADVISCSIGLRYSSYVERAIKDAVDSGRNGRGCIIVAAAGNIGSIDNTKTILYPASDPLVIAVGNINKDGLISRSSRYGKNMWVVAPGTNIMSPIPGNKYNDEASGTSLACPHVAGVAALILQRNPYLSWQQVREIIADTAVKLPPLSEDEPWNEYYGYGLVNAYNAVTNTPRSTKF